MIDWNEYDVLSVAIDTAFKAHKGQVRKLGNTPFIFHPLAVMNQVNTLKEKIVAVLHDVVEDHPDEWITVHHIIAHDTEMCDAIEILTKHPKESYDDYIDLIIEENNKIAINVKIADLKHNLSTIEAFGKHLRGKYEAKYRKSLRKLSRCV